MLGLLPHRSGALVCVLVAERALYFACKATVLPAWATEFDGHSATTAFKEGVAAGPYLGAILTAALLVIWSGRVASIVGLILSAVGIGALSFVGVGLPGAVAVALLTAGGVIWRMGLLVWWADTVSNVKAVLVGVCLMMAAAQLGGFLGTIFGPLVSATLSFSRLMVVLAVLGLLLAWIPLRSLRSVDGNGNDAQRRTLSPALAWAAFIGGASLGLLEAGSFTRFLVDALEADAVEPLAFSLVRALEWIS